MSTVPRLIEKIYARWQKTTSDGGSLKRRISIGRVELRAAGVSCRPQRNRSAAVEFQRDIADHLVFASCAKRRRKMKRMVSGGAALPPDWRCLFIGAGIPLLQGTG